MVHIMAGCALHCLRQPHTSSEVRYERPNRAASKRLHQLRLGWRHMCVTLFSCHRWLIECGAKSGRTH
ncbi:unnamed protein product [Spirodela intermedia]|uniref:Uncharacterized protein n=1 Tax=Spirodela intermedia TaxID=51605 RepID=A0A7I8IIX0_SPIIN|nr:unnamed protein product [Spirodela intermedia]CAA6657817.1 unnamed protein product [Spirodela intermedia]